MIRLGLRLALSGGRWSLVPTLLAAVAVGFGTAVLLFALSFQPALGTRLDRPAWRETPGQFDLGGEVPSNGVLLSLTSDFVDGRPVSRVDVAALGAGAPIPPGLPRLPASGEAFVSPALAWLIAEQPDALGNRFGQVVGEIGQAGLAAPDELAVVVGQPVEVLTNAGSRAVTAYESVGQMREFGLIIDVIVAVTVVGILTPVAIFVATATRLAATRRERRLVAFRLSGATPRQVAVLAAIDALLIAAPGALLGLVIFAVSRPVVAMIPLNRLTWFPEAITPPIAPAVALVMAVPVVGIIASLIALRPMSISPLGVARRVRRGPLSPFRIVPLVVALVAFAGSLTAGAVFFPQFAVIAVALSFFGIIVGIAIIGPWLTVLVGRLLASRGGVVSLLAGRRLLDDPRGSFGAVAGVILAVFVASVFFGFVAFAFHAAAGVTVPIRATTLYAEVPGGMGSAADGVVPRIEATDGVTGVVVVREAALGDAPEAGQAGPTAWIAPCAALLEAVDLPQARCGDAPIHLIRKGAAPPTVALAGLPPDATVNELGSTPTVKLPLAHGLISDRLLPETADVRFAGIPDVLIDPSAVDGDVTAIRPAFLVVATTGDPSAIERARTLLEQAMPTSGPATGADLAAATTLVIDELARVVSLGVVMVLFVAGCSLAVAVARGLLDRRRPFALLRMSGVPLGHLRSVLVLEAAAPLIAVAAASCLLGVAVSQLVLRLAALDDVPLPDPSLLVLFAGSIAGALAVVAVVLPIVRPLTSLEETRFE